MGVWSFGLIKTGFVTRLFLALAIFAPGLYLLVNQTSAQVSTETREGRWVQTGTADFTRGQSSALAVTTKGDGELSLESGSQLGIYVSEEKRTDFPFNAVGAIWRWELPKGSEITLEVRARREAEEWTDWIAFPEVDQVEGFGAPAGDLIFISGEYLQYKVTLTSSDAISMPALSELSLIYLNSTAGPTQAEAAASAAPRTSEAVTSPPIIPRSGWGADESYRYSRNTEIWPPQYEHPVKIIVHHTATSNSYTDAAAVVRAVYYYHAVTLGWGDIGYNYLVDRDGNIYEGRYGGEMVVGGHAMQYNWGSIGIAALGTYFAITPSVPMQEAVVRLLAWLSYAYGIDPTGSGYFVDKPDVPNVSGHRDVINTACPGDTLYGKLENIRDRVFANLSGYGASWVTHETPSRFVAGQTKQVLVSVRNSGTKTWTAVGGNSFRLGYHWYDSQGDQYVQPSEEDHRTSLPGDVKLGTGVELNAKITAPKIPATYTLKWDMVHEGVTWFENVGSPVLELSIKVVSTTQYLAGWGEHKTPRRMEPGATATVKIEVENQGTAWWPNSGSGAFRLGYRWYDEQGKRYVQKPAANHRTELPRPIGPGKKVTLYAKLTAPSDVGNYTLNWDIMDGDQAWLSKFGSPVRRVSVYVAPIDINARPKTLVITSTVNQGTVTKKIWVEPADFENLFWSTVVTPTSWLSLTPSYGRGTSTITATIDLSALTPGDHVGKITFEHPGAGDRPLSTVTVKVNVAGVATLRFFLPFVAR